MGMEVVVNFLIAQETEGRRGCYGSRSVLAWNCRQVAIHLSKDTLVNSCLPLAPTEFFKTPKNTF
jgi:hypothetical protein